MACRNGSESSDFRYSKPECLETPTQRWLGVNAFFRCADSFHLKVVNDLVVHGYQTLTRC